MKLTEIQKQIIESNVVNLATSTKDGKPNLIMVAYVKVTDDARILITDNYFNKTAKILLENDKVSISVWDEKKGKGWQMKGKAEYDQGGKYHRMVRAMVENEGLPAKGAVIIEINEIFNLAAWE